MLREARQGLPDSDDGDDGDDETDTRHMHLHDAQMANTPSAQTHGAAVLPPISPRIPDVRTNMSMCDSCVMSEFACVIDGDDGAVLSCHGWRGIGLAGREQCTFSGYGPPCTDHSCVCIAQSRCCTCVSVVDCHGDWHEFCGVVLAVPDRVGCAFS
jgi:hypothetical protein